MKPVADVIISENPSPRWNRVTSGTVETQAQDAGVSVTVGSSPVCYQGLDSVGQSFVGLFIYFFIKLSPRARSIGYERSLPCPAAHGEADKEIHTLGTTDLQGAFCCCSLAAPWVWRLGWLWRGLRTAWPWGKSCGWDLE